MVCGKPITHQFGLCAGCEVRLGVSGVPKRAWPDWLKALNRLYVAQQREERKQMALLVDVGAGRIRYERACYGEHIAGEE